MLKQEFQRSFSCGGGDYRAASLFPQQWQPKVMKSSTINCEVLFTLFYFLASFNVSEPFATQPSGFVLAKPVF